MVSTKSPDRIIDNHGESFIHDFYISYYDQFIIYELPYHKTHEIDNKLIYDSLKYEFFICNSKNKQGYLLKNSTDSFNKRMIGDSILTSRAYGGEAAGVDFSSTKIKTISKINNSSILIYKYVFDNEYYDSAYFHYNKELKDIKFSLDKSLDSSNNSKLFKIEFFIKHDSAAASLNLKDFYINRFEIKKVPSANEQGLRDLFERFIKDEKENYFK